MATLTRTPRPSLPATQFPESPGSWRHPRFDEIVRRQQATAFSDRNVSKMAHNMTALAALWIIQKAVQLYFPLHYLPERLYPYWGYVTWGTYYILLATRMIILYNIFVALQPLVRPKDDLADIPLTPHQRKLLGLEPTSTPPQPGSTYVTPPRYPRINRSGSRPTGSRSTSYSGSQLDRSKWSPFEQDKQGSSENLGAFLNSGKASPLDSYSASPLLHKAMGGVKNDLRRQSFGSPSPLGLGGVSRASVFEAPHTPTPARGNGLSSGLNNKWLYERQKASPVPKIFC